MRTAGRAIGPLPVPAAAAHSGELPRLTVSLAVRLNPLEYGRYVDSVWDVCFRRAAVFSAEGSCYPLGDITFPCLLCVSTKVAFRPLLQMRVGARFSLQRL